MARNKFERAQHGPKGEAQDVQSKSYHTDQFNCPQIPIPRIPVAKIPDRIFTIVCLAPFYNLSNKMSLSVLYTDKTVI
jgi:hypothetical protein|tara:strand:+ start:4307 stop:4540 length:234 start_codon:yes stop_codon:yes gene_type:complete